MGEHHSKPKKAMSSEKVMKIMDQHPDIVLQYYQSNQDKIEKYIVENFWEEDVERWLVGIRKRSPKQHLQIRKIDFMRQANAAAHKTAQYESKDLVVRRAATIDLTVYFGNRSFDAARDDIAVVFSVGEKPNEAMGSKIVCPAVDKPGEKTKWNCTLVSVNVKDKSVSLKVNIPASAIVGRYSVALDVVSGVQEGRQKTTHKDTSIIVIFNPFSKDDVVYMEDEKQRNEYVLNDRGFINVGSFGARGEGIGKRGWDFAQFDEGVLECVLLMIQHDTRMMEKPEKNLKRCNSPAFVSRVLAAMVNCNDDNGVLSGRWDGEYGDGKKPSFWSNSAAILTEWKNNDMDPVKYGQCWVFSGLMTTALRALGIPARSVTNFESAHDTDRNETVDIYVDKTTFERLDDTNDSIWNFHVWNECYFRRPDLQPKYDGWQVVDATPQEASDVVGSSSRASLMQCGPAPVAAVKEGEINVGLDTGFVFSEVNADKVYWFVDDDRKISGAPRVLSRAVGKFIGTKAVGKYETENIVGQYKYKEGSPEERKAFNKAYGLGTMELGADFEGDRKLVPAAFEVTIQEIENAFVGQNLVVKIKVKNVSGKHQRASMNVVGNSKRHTGRTHALLKKTKKTFDLDSGKTHEYSFELAHDDYMQHIVDDYAVNVTVIVSSEVDGHTTVEELDFTLEVPECISVKLPEKIYTDEDSTFDIVFTNKLPIKLSGGVFDVRARGTVNAPFRHIKLDEPILPNQSYTTKVKFHPKLGLRYIYSSIAFDCAQLKDIRHDFSIKIDL